MDEPRRILALVVSLTAVFAGAASARAATVSTTACIRTIDNQGTVPIEGAGFTPRSSVTLRSSPPGVFTSVATNDAGGFSTTSDAPRFNPFARQLQTFELTATDATSPALVATTKYQQVRVGYTTNPATGSPRRRSTHTVRGMIPYRNIWLHFRFRGRTKRNVKVGKASSPCGIASRRMALLPAPPQPGTWNIYIDHAAAFSITTRPQLRYSLPIKPVTG